MNFRFLALGLACAVSAGAFLPAAAQGLRATPQIGSGRAAAPERGPRSADFIVAVVNSEPITNNEVRTRTLRYEQQLTQQGAALPPRTQLVREVLERLITEKAQLQVARESGVRVDDSLVDAAEQDIARQNGIAVPELRRRLQADGLDVGQFREDLRNQIMLQRLRNRELEARVKVTDLDVEQFLREQEQGNTDPALTELNLAHILVALPDNPTAAQVAQAEAKARQLVQRARAGEDFSRLARENSDAAGAASNGGLIGPRTGDRLPPLFVQAVRDLPAGGITEPLRSAAGFHIVKLLEKKGLGTAGITVTQSHARHILLRPNAQLSEAAARRSCSNSRSAWKPARPTSPSSRGRTPRTPAPATAATWAGPAPACSCRNSRRRSTRCARARSPSRSSRASACT